MPKSLATNWISARCAEVGVALPFDPESGAETSTVPKGWEMLQPVLAQKLAVALHGRYPPRKVIPFARREDSDDVACVVVHDPERPPGSVVVIHDYASPGWEVVAEFDDVGGWLGSSAAPKR